MGIRVAQVPRGVAGLLTVALSLSACAFVTESENTMEPLDPPPDQTTPEIPATTIAAPASTPTATSTTVEVEELPTGDWEGQERFDVGRIDSLTTVAGHRAIRFDRYTFQHPRQGHLDAPALRSEPIAYWYQSPPYVNINPQLRTFVLDPDVTILVLDQESRPDRCGRGLRPEPSWRTVDVDHLDTREAQQRVASLTYSSDGLVTRVRFTRGC